jgi:hypothetical protein
MIWPSLPARNLDRAELQALVDELAQDPGRWREHVAFSDQKRHYVSLHRDEYVDVWLLCWQQGDDAERHYVSLYRDEFVDVWLLCWTRQNDTGWHDHDISSGAVRVVRGTVRESSPRIAGEPVTRVVDAGASFSFGPEHIHRLAGEDAQAVSLHAYSPPLWRLGQYSVDADGVMRRESVSYADELRPLQAGVAA